MGGSARLGMLAGIGDYVKDQNDRRLQQEAADRESFGKNLDRIMESDDWPEEARMAAADARHQLYSNPKLKAKDYQKLWEGVHQASVRPGVPSAEKAAATSQIPALQGLQTSVAPSQGVPAPSPETSMSLGQGQPHSPLALLRPEQSQDMNQFGGPGSQLDNGQRPSGLNLQQPQAPSGTATNPSTFNQTVGNKLSVLQPIANQPTPMISGPITRAEKNQQAMDLFKQQHQMLMEQERDKLELQRQYEKPEFSFDSKTQTILNKHTGDVRKVPGLGFGVGEFGDTPEGQMYSAHIAAAAQRGENIEDPTVRARVLDETGVQWATQHRDPNSDILRHFAIQNRIEQNQMVNKARFAEQQQRFQMEYTKYGNVNRQAHTFIDALNQGLQSGTIGGDFVAIYANAKANDPLTGVRDQEFARGEQIGSVWDRAMQRLQKYTGAGQLSPGQREDYKDVVKILNSVYRKAELLQNNRFMKMADASGMDWDAVGLDESSPHTYQRWSAYKAPWYQSDSTQAPQDQTRTVTGPPVGGAPTVGSAAIQPSANNQPPAKKSFAEELNDYLGTPSPPKR